MSVEINEAQSDKLTAMNTTRWIVFYAATFATLLGILYLLGLAGKLIVDGTVQSTSSKTVQNLSATVAILWNLSLLILFVALRRQISGSRAIFAELASIFMTLVCSISSINWFIQLLIASRISRVGESVLLALLDVRNGLSLTYAMEHLAWGVFYGIAAIFAALAIGSGRLESWIRWLFIAGGVLSLLHVIGVIAPVPIVSDLGYVAWGILLPITTALLAVRFRVKQK